MTDFPIVNTADHVTRQVMADHPDMMMVAFRFAREGAIGALHDHPHVQSTYVASGRFRMTVGDRTLEIGPGDSLVVPSGTPHGCVCLEPGQLVDCFTPRRDDFL